ncbi:MAG TPA: bifunctional DNA-binding transcriptional regulator/O6-methylguanine-DNA methyltransferase Ada [Candidatus Aquilonibacter sp.]|nr:bifunctional DNA-binding transcriptional regulator/O6-methylguanine-DNA methyltransferase Ada [Candidatus Aquilonibacter sp.]
MTATNITFPIATGSAILSEDDHNAMPLMQSSSIQAGSAESSRFATSDIAPSGKRQNQKNQNQSNDNDDDRCWDAVIARDSRRDGQFVFAVATTGVYCRPSCPARRPRRKNVKFFSRPDQAEKAGFRECLRCRPRSISGNPQLDFAKEICRFIEQHLDEPVTLGRLSKLFHQSPFHLQRRFKAALGITPRAYADSCRLRQLKRNLQAGDNVTRAMYDAGYSSSSRLYEKTSSQLGMTPDKYRRGAIATSIRYACADSPLGRMLIAATDKGICSIQFADSDSELIEGLKREFPFAARKQDDGGVREWVEALLSKMTGKDPDAALPLDIRATAFQQRVWTYLRSIPFGATRTYQDVAKAIGQPAACRAVARACATNPLAVAIPCHRVVRADGNISGYRWGVARKKVLLKMEQTRA